MVTYEKLFSDGGSFEGYEVYVDGKYFESCEAYKLHEVLKRAERSIQ